MPTSRNDIGIARFKGFARLSGQARWDLQCLLSNLDSSIAEAEAERIEWADLWIDKFRMARRAIADLINANGEISDIFEREPSPPPVLAEWEIFGDAFAYPRLEGLSFGHPLLTGFGRPICTSLLLYIDTDQGYARTLSRYYRLGRKRAEQYDA